MTIDDKILDQLIAGYKKPEDLIGENGLLRELTKRLLERAMKAELTEHLGHEKNETVKNSGGNVRNGGYKKRVKGEFGELSVSVLSTAFMQKQRPVLGCAVWFKV